MFLFFYFLISASTLTFPLDNILGASHSRPVHILVATPGRLCELITDEEIPMFRDMSGIRFLIVDEADRIVEEGHFPEVKIVSRDTFTPGQQHESERSSHSR